MTYLNPVFIYGYDKFFKNCKNFGISGIIIPDLPFEEQDEAKLIADKYEISTITMVAPTSSEERIEKIAKSSNGFIYLVSSMGITGARTKIETDIRGITEKIKKYSDIPVAIGFGINSREQVVEFSKYVYGVIVGSAIVKIIEEFNENADIELKKYIKSII
jgi:tryptophan synthase alpha chain